MGPTKLTEAERLLTLLAEGEEVTFQAFDDRGEDRSLARVLHGDLDEHAEALANLNRGRAGIFWMVNQGDGRGRRAENVIGIRALFVDLDGAPLPGTWALQPHVVVESSPRRYHAYWAVADCPLDRFAPLQRALAAKFSGDPAVCDLPRVMRLPGFLHQKNGSFMARIIHEHPVQPYPLVELINGLGLDLINRRSRAAPMLGIEHDSTLKALSAQGLVKGQIHGKPGAWDILCPWRDAHTSGDDGTCYFEPHTNGYAGAGFRCQHGHCTDKTTQDLRAFLGWGGSPAKAPTGDNPPIESYVEDFDKGPPASAKAPARAEPRLGNGAAPGANCESRVLVVRGDALRVEPIRWLWNGWLARGKLHMLAGAPGTGKSTIALTLAAVVTAGGRWPDGTKCTPGHVLAWSGEDDPSDTLLPRLLAAGGDPRRLHIVSGTVERDGLRQFDPATDIPALLTAAREIPDCVLALVDPVVAAVLGDSHKNTEVRRALQPLVGFASELDAAVLGVSHFTKGTAGRDPVERVTGSVAFGALPRVVMAAARGHEADAEQRLFCRAKSNIGPDTGGWDYRLDLGEVPGTPGVTAVWARWGKVLKGSARDLLAEAEATGDPEEKSELDDAVEWLRKLLANGPVDSKEIRSDAKQAGIAWRTVERAKARLGVKPSKAGFSGGWRWSLSGHSDPEDDRPSSHIGGLGGLGGSEPLQPSCGAGSTEDRQGAETVGGLGGDGDDVGGVGKSGPTEDCQAPEDRPPKERAGGLRQNLGRTRVLRDRDAEGRQDRQGVGDRGCLGVTPGDDPDTEEGSL